MSLKKKLLCICILGSLFAPVSLQAADQIEGTVLPQYVPWSGYWWAGTNYGTCYRYNNGTPPGPAEKYDEYVDHFYPSNYYNWEHVNHYSTDNWAGHCHAWAIASYAEPEPKTPNNRGYNERILNVGDQKAYLTEMHYSTPSDNFWGERYDGPSNDPDDLSPNDFEEALFAIDKTYPTVFDIDRLEQVWNYPAYRYSCEYTTLSPTTRAAVTTVYFADDGVLPDFVGKMDLVKTYYYNQFDLDQDGEFEDSEWTGASVTDHPDFAWDVRPSATPVPDDNHPISYTTARYLSSSQSNNQIAPAIPCLLLFNQ